MATWRWRWRWPWDVRGGVLPGWKGWCGRKAGREEGRKERRQESTKEERKEGTGFRPGGVVSERFVSHKIEDCEALLAMRVDVVFRWTCLVACLGLTFVGAREERRWWSRRLVDGVPDEDPWEMDGSYEDSSVPQFMYREGRAWFEDPRDEKFLARTRYPRWPFEGILESFEDAVSPFDDAVTPFDDEVDAIQTQGEFLQHYLGRSSFASHC